MIYVYLTLFILSLLGLAYTFYSLEINRKLNIKKRQFAIRPNRNKFYIIFCINVLLILTFGSLFVFKLVYRPKVPVIPVEEKENFGKPVDKTTPITILTNDVEYCDYDVSKSYRNNYYYYLDGKLYCYDVKSEETISSDIPSSNFMIIKNKVVVYYDVKEESTCKTHIEIYDGTLLRLEKEIVIDAKMKECFGSTSIFLGNMINVVGESFDVKEIDKIGYVETVYSYEEVDEEIVVNKEEKVFIKDVLSPQYHNYDRVVIHLQYNISSDSIKISAICLSDYYLTNVEGYLYFFCNAYEKDRYSNESFILKYNPFDLSISDYHMYSNIIYSSPSVHSEGITTYLTFVMYNSSYQNYQLVTIDNDLGIIDVKETYIDTKGREYGSNDKNKIIFDNKIITVNNILSFDNNSLVNYEVNASEKTIVINEYKLTDLVINKYVLAIGSDFTNGKILEITKFKDEYFLVFELDGKQGIVHFPIYQDEEKEESEETEEVAKEVKVNEVVINLDETSDNKYFIINNELLTITKDDEDNEVITIEKIENILKEESGE